MSGLSHDRCCKAIRLETFTTQAQPREFEAFHGNACHSSFLLRMMVSKYFESISPGATNLNAIQYDTKRRRRRRRGSPSIAASAGQLANGATVASSLAVSRLRAAVIHHMSHQNLPGIGTAARAAEAWARVAEQASHK
jgi:hypothetical protein